MKKKKNYLTLFLAYCRKKEIWFSVGIDSAIQACTYMLDGNSIDFEPPLFSKVGSKASYEWIKKEVQEIERELRYDK